MFHHWKVLVLLLVFATFGSALLPSYIKVCSRDNPDIPQCIKDSVYELRPKLKEGIPELDVPPIEPLMLDEVQLRSGPNTAKIDANITNIKVWGPSTFELLELRPNIKKSHFAFRARIPFLHFEGEYDMDLNVLLLKHKGQGPITGNFTNYAFDCVLKGNRVQRDGAEYLKFEKMSVTLYIGKTTLYLGNLFRNDPVISKATNEVINDNTDLFINEIKPVLEDALAEKFTDIANKITLKFTYQELFP